MNFLNPLMLYGLAATAIPLIIHLLTRRRAKDVPFPSIELLERMKTTRLRRLRLKQLLLIILRTLIIAMIVLAFARPALKSSFRGGARTSAVILLDASASMQYIHNGEMLFETAEGSARDILDILSDSDMAGIIVAGRSPHPLGNGLTTDKKALVKALSDVEPGYGAPDMTAAFSAAAQMLESSTDPNKEVYFITDGASNALPDSVPVIRSSYRIYSIVVGPEHRGGAVIDDFSLDTPLVVAGKPVDFSAQCAFGFETAEADIEFFVDGERKGKSPITRSQGEIVHAPFSYIPETPGWYSVSSSIDDNRFEQGETRRIVLRTPGIINVLLAGGTEDDLYYLEKALNPDPERNMFRITKRIGQTVAPEDIRNADVIVLSAEKSMTDETYASLVTAVVERGAGLVVFPPRMLDERLYAEGLFRDLFPARVENRIDLGAGTSSSAVIDRFDIAHPILNGISKEGSFTHPSVTSYIRLRPTGNHEVIARFGDGSPAVADAVCGKGRVIVYAVSASGDQSDLPLTGIFIPLFIRSVQYLSGSDIVGPHFETGDDVSIQLGDIPADAQVSVKPENASARSVDVEYKDGGARLAGLDADIPGFYSVLVNSLERIRYSVDIPRDEAGFERAGHQVAAAAFKNVPWKQFDAAANPAKQVIRDRFGQELYGLFLLMAALLLAVEMVVARKA